ncbi:hypothetical protein [Bradyrhizobium sp. LHD-71]|uniref:hypothetical protein n=1 Tax=Bradyrhizobium sp. LHD-71 TaxID=3072141 RepID=UPI00280EF70A|nr:hypothetical protein [Bradyrhizobium sp. LHD-71]MDQ8726699.1 hypothetical protein [Bradyrhizobium sp. LHD-71]
MPNLKFLHLALIPAASVALATMSHAQQPALSNDASPAVAPAASPQAMAEYRRKLRDYTLAWQSFDSAATAYWNAVTEKRRLRMAKRRHGQEVALDDYVLTQPPVYDGPPRPIDPSAPDKPAPVPRDVKYVPTIPEMLASAQKYFHFVPQRPASEIEFKRAYARAVAAEGVPADLAVRLYAFETGGIGTYDVQSGLLNARPGAKPLSPAIGYNQLLITYTMHLLADHGDDFVRALTAKAAALTGARHNAMTAKMAALRRMIAFSRTVPSDWNSQEKLGETQQGWGVHAVLLDIDIGPLLQARKLVGSIRFARMRGYRDRLTAAELQMMNLTGDGSGLDIIMMPQVMRERVPTSNFFQRRGYERNTVASRNNTVAKLLSVTDARMDAAVQQPGARDLAASFQ